MSDYPPGKAKINLVDIDGKGSADWTEVGLMIETHGTGEDAFQTTDRYWDCECEFRYIHSRNVDNCLRCGAVRESQPDSRINELDNLEAFA